MHFKQILFCILCIIIFFFILATPSIAFSGVSNGLSLWVHTLLPALFPSILLITVLLKFVQMPPFLSYLYVLFAGLLSGFPMGAYLCGEYHKNHPKESVCNELVAFCNVSSPAFVCNYIIRKILPNNIPWILTITCIYLPIIECIVYIIFSKRKQICSTKNTILTNTTATTNITTVLDDSIMHTVTTLLKLCGYIVLFSCITAYICYFFTKQSILTAYLCCFTEITNGLYLTKSLSMPQRMQFILIICTNAWGGLSTLLQTSGITHDCKIDIKKYTCNKLILTLITFINAWFLTCIFKI